MQQIRFGMHLDAGRGWRLRDHVGEPVLGPLGLLQLLELQLGLARAPVSWAERVVQMRECLDVARTGSRFYEKSFAIDALGTAETLLGWRDLWYEHGWSGDGLSEGSSRLADMVAVELLARERVAPGMGQRLAAVAQGLNGRRVQVQRIALEEPLESLPVRWQTVLRQLPCQGPPPMAARARPGTDLQALQAALLAAHRNEAMPAPRPLTDGSVRVLRAETHLAAAQWLAHQLPSASADMALVIERFGPLLDAALEAADRPRMGLVTPSPFRPVLQLLPLALRLLQEPMDFEAVLQFLNHPVNPLPKGVRHPLAARMAERPGVGGQAWDEFLAGLAAAYGERADDVLNELRYWLEHPRASRDPGLPIAVLVERTARLGHWFGEQTQAAETRAAFARAREAAHTLEKALLSLQGQGTTHLPPAELDKLLARAQDGGMANPGQYAQIGAVAAVFSPAALIDTFPEVLWWPLTAPDLPPAYPWSPSEVATLKRAGVALPDAADVLAQRASSWLRPVLQAQERLTLVLPPEGEELHPLWWLVRAAVADPDIRSVESLLTGQSAGEALVPVAHRPLPARRRWWQLPATASLAWDRPYSYSALEPLLFNPFQWVLQYPARLRAATLLELANTFRLKGLLAHRLVEKLYRTEGSLAWSPDRVATWLEGQFDTLVQEEGAVLLMPGRRGDRLALRSRLRRAIPHLHGLLRDAGVTRVDAEEPLKGLTEQGELVGYVDLLLTLPGGRRMPLDMKWAGEKKYRDKLLTQRHYQLVVYGKLLQLANGVWPPGGYYILDSAALLTGARHVFPSVSPLPVEEGTEALAWQQLEVSWAWRAGQLRDGAIEVVLPGLEATAGSEPPAAGLPADELSLDYNPFVYLAGWEG